MAFIDSEAFLALDEDTQQELVEFFVFGQYEIAAELGIEPNLDGGPAWTDEEAQRIWAVIERRHLPVLIGSASSTTA